MNDKDVEFAELVGTSSVRKGPEHFKECQALYVKSINKEKRQITALASAGTLDRDNEIILPEAFKEMLPVYMKNPVVITTHQHRLQTGSSSVIGNVVRAWIDRQGLWVVIEFVAGTALGDEYWLLYSTKKQRAFSVGFIPIEHTYEERDGKQVWVYTKIELLEISCVPVGSSREALSRSKQRKADFIAAKKAEREEEKILTRIRAEDPDFDAKREEFAEAISEFEGEGEIIDDFGAVLDCDFAKIFNSKDVGPYASMF